MTTRFVTSAEWISAFLVSKTKKKRSGFWEWLFGAPKPIQHSVVGKYIHVSDKHWEQNPDWYW